MQLFLAHQRRNALDQCRLVGLVGQLGDDNAHAAAAHLLKVGFGLQDQPRLADGVALGNGVGVFIWFVFPVAVENATGGEVRPLNKVHQLLDRDVVNALIVVNHKGQGIDNLAQVVGRDIGRHADGDTAGAVDQQVGQRGGDNVRFAQGVVKVRVPADRVAIQVFQHQVANLG